jgi:hypothetical protein
MMRGRKSLRDSNSQAPSPDGSEDDEQRSPVSPDGESLNFKTPKLKTPARGRKAQTSSENHKDQLDSEEA